MTENMKDKECTMAAAEENSLAARARGGDGEAVVGLIHLFLPVIKSMVRSFYLSHIDYEDLLQEGMLGLLKAIRSFDSGKALFRSYASVCISNQINSAVRAAFSRKNAPLTDSVPLEEEPELGGGPNPEEIYIDRERFQAARGILCERLSRFELQVLELYVDGYSYAEIAGYLSTSVKSVDNAVQRFRRKLIHSLTD